LRSTDSIDVLDAMASSVKIDVVNNLVVRILPRLDEGLNEE
jgi:NADH-quinone oxidoreductase subunit G